MCLSVCGFDCALSHLELHIYRAYIADVKASIVTFLLIAAGLQGTAFCQYVAGFSSYHNGNRFDFRLTREQLTKTPAWHDDEPNPPLSARQARSVGTEYLKKIFEDGDQWTLSNITLSPVADRWVYLIAFIEPPRGCADCFSTPFTVVVTMDGVAVPVNVSPWPPPSAP